MLLGLITDPAVPGPSGHLINETGLLKVGQTVLVLTKSALGDHEGGEQGYNPCCKPPIEVRMTSLRTLLKSPGPT